MEHSLKPVSTPDRAVEEVRGTEVPEVAAAFSGVPFEKVEWDSAELLAQHRLLFERHPMPMWVFDRETLRFLAVNDAAVRHYGYERDEFLTMRIRDIRPPAEQARLDAALADRNAGTLPYRSMGLWRHQRKDGNEIWVAVQTASAQWNGRPAQLVTATDVSGLVRVQEEATRRRDEVVDIVESMGDGFTALDSDLRFTYINGHAEKMAGFSAANLLGRTLQEAFPAANQSDLEREYHRVLADGVPAVLEQYSERFGGWIELRVYRRSQGGLAVFVRDITERRRAEALLAESAAALQASEALLGGIIDSARDAVVTCGDDLRILVFNPAAETLFGYAAAEVIGRPIDLLIPDAIRPRHIERVRRFGILDDPEDRDGTPMRKPHTAIIARARHRDGNEIPVEATVAFAAAGTRHVYTALMRDISERQRQEEEREKMIAEQQRLIAEQQQLIRDRAEAALMQRVFLRDVLFSVTEGRLRLCDDPADLPEPGIPFAEVHTVQSPAALADIRRLVCRAAEDVGLAPTRAFDLMAAASECAMNAYQHGGQNPTVSVHLVSVGEDTRASVQVWVRDQGKGINMADLPKATLMKGHSNAGSFGHGFFLMLHTADVIHLMTGPRGTTIALEMYLTGSMDNFSVNPPLTR